MNGVSLALGILCVVAFIGSCTCQCPDCWTQFQGKCYLFSSEDLTFKQAEMYCRARQASLVRIDNVKEDEFLQSHSALYKNATRWMGLSDARHEGKWKYIDGTIPIYMNWSPGEPNNVIMDDGVRGSGENCAVLYCKINYQWNDGACRSLHRPICEKPVEPCHHPSPY